LLIYTINYLDRNLAETSGQKIKMFRLRYLLLAHCLLASSVGAANSARKSTCEKEWAELKSDSRFVSTTSKIERFESFAPICAGSGLYEVQLSQLYLEARQFSKAEQVLETALKNNLPHRKELLFKEGIAYFISQDLTRAQNTFKTLIREFPESYEGYSGLGGILLAQHQPKDSIEQYEKANSLNPSAVANRNLTIAYTQVRRYPEASSAFDMYYRLDNTAFGDRDAAISAAIAYAQQGKLELADGTLRGLLTTRPEMKDDKTFVQMFRQVNADLNAKKK
jgi:tetratricopeptide (TPR) repeat protein